MNPPALATAWRLVLETALDAVVVMDRDGKVVDWNDNATAVFGWTADDVRGRTMADFIIPQRFRQAHAQGLRHFLSTGHANVLGQRIDIWGLRRTGEEFPIELSISPISDETGLIFVGFLRDISERRAAERQREQHALKMEALYQAISFAAENNSFEDALQSCLASVHKLTGWPLGHVYLPSDSTPARLVPSQEWFGSDLWKFPHLLAATENTKFALGEGLPGRVWQSKEPAWIVDVSADPNFPRARWPGGIEIRSAVGFPIISSDLVVAVIEFFSETVAPADAELLLTLRAIGQQVGRVFERRRAERVLRDHTAALEVEIAERVRAENHQKLLLAEVNHRVKNMLAVVTAIATQTARNSKSIESFSESFLARLRALDGANSLVTSQSWKSVSMADLVETVLSPYRSGDQLLTSGESLMLPPKAVVSLALVLHELVTNAAKYGALSVSKGKVALKWERSSEPPYWVKLHWEESGIGPVAHPTRTGFGSAMIKASIQHDLNGKVDTRYGTDGLSFDLAFPLKPSS